MWLRVVGGLLLSLVLVGVLLLVVLLLLGRGCTWKRRSPPSLGHVHSPSASERLD